MPNVHVNKREKWFSLTCTALVQKAERAAPEGGEAHAEHSADVTVYRRGDDAFLQTERSLVHKPGGKNDEEASESVYMRLVASGGVVWSKSGTGILVGTLH